MKESTEKQKIRIAGGFEKHFRHFGFRKTVVDDVANDLGVSKKTIYKLFSSKEDIFYYVISRKAEVRKIIVEKKIKHIPSAKGKMDEMIRINFTEFRKIHKRKGKALDERFQSEIASGAFRQAFKQLLSDIITQGVERKEFEVCDHEMTVRYIQALISETVMAMRQNPDSKPEEFLVFTVNKLLIKNC